jgi:hypothetical protein
MGQLRTCLQPSLLAEIHHRWPGSAICLRDAEKPGLGVARTRLKMQALDSSAPRMIGTPPAQTQGA